MTETPGFAIGRAFGRGRARERSLGSWLLPAGALAFSVAQLACSKSEPQPTTPQIAPSAVATTAPASAGSANGVTAGDSETRATSQPQSSTQAAPASTGGRWPSALGALSPTPNSSSPSTAQPPSTPEPAPLTALASNGESSQITGCLAAAPSKQAPTRSAPTRSASSDGATWRATALGNGVLVTHTFEHACCLQGSAKATVSGSTITIEEQLTGQPCRCVCESTIQTRVPAPPGEYDVQSVTVTNGHRHVVQTQHVKVGISSR